MLSWPQKSPGIIIKVLLTRSPIPYYNPTDQSGKFIVQDRNPTSNMITYWTIIDVRALPNLSFKVRNFSYRSTFLYNFVFLMYLDIRRRRRDEKRCHWLYFKSLRWGFLTLHGEKHISSLVASLLFMWLHFSKPFLRSLWSFKEIFKKCKVKEFWFRLVHKLIESDCQQQFFELIFIYQYVMYQRIYKNHNMRGWWMMVQCIFIDVYC